MPHKRLFTTTELAKLLKVSPSTILRWHKLGMKNYKRSLVFEESDINDFLLKSSHIVPWDTIDRYLRKQKKESKEKIDYCSQTLLKTTTELYRLKDRIENLKDDF